METEPRNSPIPPASRATLSHAPIQITPVVIWLTGLSGAGKTTLAEIVCRHLQAAHFPVQHLDGDKVRSLNPNLGFTKHERIEHIKNVGQVASRLERDGSMVVVSLISPYREARDHVRSLCQNFIEVYVSTPLFECARRDVKGLYKKALAGEIDNFTGVSAPYEPPVRPNLAIDTLGVSPQSCAQLILDYVQPFLSGKRPQQRIAGPKAN
jgi:adenylylsulfate kinase